MGENPIHFRCRFWHWLSRDMFSYTIILKLCVRRHLIDQKMFIHVVWSSQGSAEAQFGRIVSLVKCKTINTGIQYGIFLSKNQFTHFLPVYFKNCKISYWGELNYLPCDHIYMLGLLHQVFPNWRLCGWLCLCYPRSPGFVWGLSWWHVDTVGGDSTGATECSILGYGGRGLLQ